MQRYVNIPETFINFDISPYVGVHNPVQFTLSSKGKFPFDAGLLADQITYFSKLTDKIHSFSKVYALITPRSFEQSSSEKVALFKSGLIKGERLLDICGGLGVDDWAFSKSFKEVISIDMDADLNKIVRSNFIRLKCFNVERLDQDAYIYVENNVDRFDAVYMDADRRVGTGRGVFFEDTEPNILKIKEKLFSFTDTVWLKVSPMFDISKLIQELETVVGIWVIAERNEVKELLVQMKPESSTSIALCAVDLKQDETFVFEGKFESKHDVVLGDEGAYIIEPSLALIKAGLVSDYFKQYNILQLAPNSFLGLSDTKVENVMGRQFKVKHRELFAKSTFQRYVKENNLNKANITKRNFPMDVAAFRKQFKISEGGDDYVFLTTNVKGEKMVFHGVRD